MCKKLFFFFLFMGIVLLEVEGQVMNAVVQQKQLPVLINKPDNQIIDIVCRTTEPVDIRGMVLKFKGTTDIKDIRKVGVRIASSDKVERWITVAETGIIRPEVKIPVSYLLKDSVCFSIVCDLSETTRLDHFVDIQCVGILTDKGDVKPVDSERIVQRTGVAVQDAGWNGVNTYRIPGIATTVEGTLLAIYDNRYENSRDLQGHMDIGMSRSTDRGQTWEPMRVVLDMGEWGGLPQKFNGVSDAGILVDKNSGNVFIAGLWMHGVLDNDGKWIEGLTTESRNWQHQWVGRGSQPGLDVRQTCQFLIAESRDDGKTWDKPVNITVSTKNPEWWLFAPAPGQGITMKDGTLVFPTQGRDVKGEPFSNITYSKDGGKSWKTSRPSYSNTTECAVVELSDGSLMLNMRNNRNREEKGDKNGRAVYITKDLGETWEKHPTSENVLIEPVCMASLYKHNYGKNKSVLLFSNPDSKYDRNHLTVKASFDDGMTWTKGIVLDDGYSFGYSCITSVDEKTIGILYESSCAQMVFQSIALDELK